MKGAAPAVQDELLDHAYSGHDGDVTPLMIEQCRAPASPLRLARVRGSLAWTPITAARLMWAHRGRLLLTWRSDIRLSARLHRVAPLARAGFRIAGRMQRRYAAR